MQKIPGQAVELGRRVHQPQRQPAEGYRQGAKHQCQQCREQQALHQHLAQRTAVTAATGLGCETGGAHAQKAEHADDQDVQAAAHRHGAQLMGMGQVADHRGIDQRHQWHGQVGEDHRRRQRPDLAVGWRVAPGITKHRGSLYRRTL